MAKSKKRTYNFLVIVIFFIVLIALAMIWLMLGKVTPNNSYQNLNTVSQNTYTSPGLQLSINLPEGYVVKDTGITLKLTKNGEITIIRNGTNYSNVNEYLSDFKHPFISVINSYKQKINDYDMVVRDEKQGASIYKVYYIYVNNAVYIFSTTSTDLYGDLDQIARSFRYNP